MTILAIHVEDRGASKARLKAAFKGKPQGAHYSFPTMDAFMKVLTLKRWELLQAMIGQGSMSVREAARRVDRDVKSVHGDLKAMLLAGVIDKDEAGQVVFPYDAVHVDFTVSAAA
jgi:predicted transcriptional regulator